MPSSDARILANQQNAARSTGPRTEAGKLRSRGNAFKHGLTGAGIVMPEEDAAEVERRTKALGDELKPPGEVGALLVRQIATLSVRMERSFEQETAALSERVRQVMDEFEAPEGVDDETAEKLRIEAGHVALFDPSKEACLARRYEAAARRGFFRALNDLRQLKKNSTVTPAADPAAENRASMARMGSFLQAEVPTRSKPAPVASKPAPIVSKPLPVALPVAPAAWDPFPTSHFDLPMAIGRPR